MVEEEEVEEVEEATTGDLVDATVDARARRAVGLADAANAEEALTFAVEAEADVEVEAKGMASTISSPSSSELPAPDPSSPVFTCVVCVCASPGSGSSRLEYCSTTPLHDTSKASTALRASPTSSAYGLG